jgi:hypothetical protein
MRGAISFALSYGTVSLYNNIGYDGAFGLFGGLTAAFGAMGVIIYYTSKKIRQLVSPWTQVEKSGLATIG